ncbi:MAG TPA: HU family DNA-binding protein [Paludibacteraceae bacterium]|nr:HU family DNA-binding protein [Paludibacteraceae bacterium]
MSNAKLSASEIVELMVKDRMITKKSAEEFVKVFFSVIEDALKDGETVKIKGLGTFKSQWNEARKSVNVNTGEEIVIDGYYKAVFIPENDLRELINEPFSHLEPVELNPLSDNLPEQMQDDAEEDEPENFSEPLEPLRVFGEQAEEIKELLSEINSFSTPKVRSNDTVTENESSQLPDPDEKTEEEITLENTPMDKPESVSEVAEIISAPETLHTPEHTGNKETEFNFDGFDIVREISTRFGLPAGAAAVALINEESDQLPAEAESETESNISEVLPEEIPENTVAAEKHEIDDREAEDDNNDDEKQEKFEEIDDDDETDENEADDETDEESDEDEADDETDEDEQLIPEDDTEAEDGDDNDEDTDETVVELPEVVTQTDEEAAETIEADNTAAKEKSVEPLVAVKNARTVTDKKKIVSTSSSHKRRRHYHVEEKKKRPVWLYTLLGIAALGLVFFGAFYFVKNILDKQKDAMYMEYLADSTVRALNTKEVLDSMTPAGDSIATTDTVAVKATDESVQTVISEAPAAGNIFDAPRNYTELITTEKMVAGSQLTKFARKYYGHPHFWVYIYEANREAIKDPNNVPLGINIKIPKLDARLADPASRECLNYALKLQSEYLK